VNEVIHYTEEDCIISVGEDGYLRWWMFLSIDAAATRSNYKAIGFVSFRSAQPAGPAAEMGGTAEENVEESAAPVPDGDLSAANATDQVVRLSSAEVCTSDKTLKLFFVAVMTDSY
jgi:hypothetical protein